MKGQRYVWFPKEVTAMMEGNYQAMLHGNYEGVEEMVVPLFKELSPEEEQAFRRHARETYVPGTEINGVYHPAWQAEARKMNEEAAGLREKSE